MINLTFQPKRSSPVPTTSTSQIQRNSSIDSDSLPRPVTSTTLDDLMRNATTDFQLPEDAMRDLSLEEREHIQRVMNSVSRAHTTPQESRR